MNEKSPSSPGAGALQTSGPSYQVYVPGVPTVQEWRPQTLKHGDTFGVFNQYGDIVAGERYTDGLYHEDTRFLSRFELRVNGRRPLLLSSAVRDDNGLLTVDLTNPDMFDGGRIRLPQDTIHISRAKFLWQDACRERIALRNFDNRPHALTLSFLFGGDFADLFEVRGRRRPRRGSQSAETTGPGTVVLTYEGLDHVTRCTNIHFDPAPDRLDTEAATFELTLEPEDLTSLFVVVTCGPCDPEKAHARHFFTSLRQARKSSRESASKAATITTSNEIFNEVLCRSMADLYMLMTETAEGPYPYAGIPWFSTAFGRDGIITAMEMLWIDPGVAKGVLKFLAANQAKAYDPTADAEPGKILHETRRGEMARLGEVPFGLYYGAVDTTPLFVMLAGMYWQRTGDLETITELWSSIEAALRWIDTDGDPDGDGFVEYRRKNDSGLANQGWKDSHDSIFHADGRLAEGPIALAEVQGYVYAARCHAAAMARGLGFTAVAATLEQHAQGLRERFDSAFWCADMGMYVLALDGDKRPCRVRTSNAGQVLFTGIASPERARTIAGVLLGQEFFSGWGIRTVSASAARYNPMSYHNGSVWPHDNALIALGLARYGLVENIERIFTGLFDAAVYMDLRRLPELFCGFRRRKAKGPTYYPVACAPQAWASAAPFALMQACLGLGFDHRAGEIRFEHPRLPGFLDEVLIRSLRLGDSCMDIHVRRYGSEVTVEVLERRGDARVTITL